MGKHRSKTYVKSLINKAVKFYFINPHITIQEISDKFNINAYMLSEGISDELKKRFNNSAAKKFMSNETED